MDNESRRTSRNRIIQLRTANSTNQCINQYDGLKDRQHISFNYFTHNVLKGI